MSKLPAIQFYPGDWRKDVGVQSLSFHDRGVWFEILMLMHESSYRGKLLLGNKPISDDVLSGILRIDITVLKQTLETLIERGVTEKDKTGALISRRMLRDEKLRAEYRGKMNAWRKSKKLNNNCNENVTPVVTEMLPLSSSSSSSSILKGGPRPQEIELVYKAYPLKKSPAAARTAIAKAIVRLKARGESNPTAFLIGKIADWQRSRERDQANGKFVPPHKHPATWFNGECYDDEMTGPSPAVTQRRYIDPATLYSGPEYTPDCERGAA